MVHFWEILDQKPGFGQNSWKSSKYQHKTQAYEKMNHLYLLKIFLKNPQKKSNIENVYSGGLSIFLRPLRRKTYHFHDVFAGSEIDLGGSS